MPLFRSLGCTLLLALPYPAVAQSASAPAQRQIVAAVDAGQADAVALLGRLVGARLGQFAEIAAGIALFGIGLKILIEHLTA